MDKIVSGTEMKKIDKLTIESVGIPSLVLMERAAYSVVKLMIETIDKASKVIVVAGTGNNGADGLAICRMLYLEGYDTCIYIFGDKTKSTKEFKTQLNILNNIGINELSEKEFFINQINSRDVIVDAVFGVGLSRNVEGMYADVIEKVNTSNAKVFAVDIPSGINADNGKVMNVAVKADYTVAFGCFKIGNVLYPGADYCGQLICEDIGFPEIAYKNVDKILCYHTKEDLKLLPERPNYSNKGTFGKLLIIAGSKDISGAAYLCAKAAFRTGAGLVRILTTNENKEVIQRLIPEAMVSTYDTDKFDYEVFEACLNWCNVIAIGPGLAVGKPQKLMVEGVLDSRKPAVIDADGINNISESQALKKKLHKNIILTPHLGEMSRLIVKQVKEIADNLIYNAYNINYLFNANCILKDSRTVCANADNIFVNLTGNNGMATAGSGDVLTGIAAGLLAIGMDINLVVSMAPFIHGLAGDLAAVKMKQASMMATDIIEEIKNVIYV